MIRRAFVDTSHGQIHYRESGEGAPLVLLHQTPDSSRAFEPAMPGLSSRRVLAIDTLGYGDSDAATRSYSMSDYADSVAAFLDALSIERAAVLGKHTGAGIAVEFAARHPDRATALVAVGIPFWDAEEREQLRSVYAVPFELQEDGGHLEQAWAKIRRRTPDATLEMVERSTVDMLKAPRPMAAYDAVFDYDMEPRLSLIRCPALVIAGDGDALWKCSEPAARLIPDGTTHTFAGIGGYLIDLRTDDFVATVLDFLNAKGA